MFFVGDYLYFSEIDDTLDMFLNSYGDVDFVIYDNINYLKTSIKHVDLLLLVNFGYHIDGSDFRNNRIKIPFDYKRELPLSLLKYKMFDTGHLDVSSGFIEYVLSYDLALEKSLVIPDGIEVVSRKGEQSGYIAERVQLGNSIKAVTIGTFTDFTKLRQITLPDSLLELEAFAFSNCNSLEELNLPNRLRKIGEHCFEGCASLTKLVIPRSVEVIGTGAFANCKSMRKLYIPSEYKSKQNSMAFYGLIDCSIIWY